MQNEQENSKNQKEEDASIPLLDLNQSSIKKLLSQAKSKGYLTYSELNETMPPGEMSSEQIEDIMTALSEMGITLIDSEDEKGLRWSTVGVSANILDASFQALLDSINWKLIKEGAIPN